MKSAVEKAIGEIRSQFPLSTVLVAEDGDGGAFVIVENVDLGSAFTPSTSWLGFHIVGACPYADTYPFFIDAAVTRANGAQLPEGLTTGHNFPPPGNAVAAKAMPARKAIQVSRRSNRRDSSGIETPRLKALKVVQWLRSL